jgi:hypothetical protein
MVSHEAKGVNLKVGLLTGFTKRFEEKLPIGVASHDAITMITSAHHVIDSARILYTKFASHWPNRGLLEGDLSILLTDPFTAIWKQRTMPTRPPPQNLYDASSAFSLIRKSS